LPTAAKLRGLLLPVPGVRSTTSRVPAAVPSVTPELVAVRAVVGAEEDLRAGDREVLLQQTDAVG
jgi:hypothetical protein